tara:strand:+ start:57 stop:383 length:327 start_codon:yes stop_codon:yes gene_type:complete
MKKSSIVYSTETLIKSDFDKEPTIVAVGVSDQKVRLHLDRKGGGKVITVVKGLADKKENLIQLAKELKKKCGVGGSFKNNEILIQGNKREIIKDILTNKGYNVKLSGG